MSSAPWPPPKLPHSEPPPPVDRKGHIMVDLTQIEQELSVGLSVAQRVLPFLLPMIGFPAPIVAYLLAALNGVQHLADEASGSTASALNQATSHVTPGLPNVAEMGPSK